MTTMKLSIREARERFSEIVEVVSAKGERIILTSRNKPKAAIVSLKDVEVLQDMSMRKRKKLLQLEQIKALREKLARRGVVTDSVSILREMREERSDHLAGGS